MPRKKDEEKEIKQDIKARMVVLSGEQEERIARRRAETLNLPYISLQTFPTDADVLELIPRHLAEQAHAVLFHKQGKDVRVGVVNPSLPAFAKFRQAVTNTVGVEPQPYVISHRSLQVALSRYRREQRVEVTPQDEMRITSESLSAFTKTIRDLHTLGQHITTLPPTEVLATVVSGAVKLGASDVHIEPKEKEARLRYRIDGVLQDITEFALPGWQLLLSRVKVLAKLKLNVHETPQDGSFVLRVGEATYDMRVSILPGDFGENIVMRILNRAAEAVRITDLGMKERDYAVVLRELRRSNGMILTTGPTGSGKTTSLASFLREVNTPELKIITLEDPIEYRLSGVEQTQVDTDAGYTFAKGLRAILRQDPDVIMVGEMRDTETAETAMHAALTGHLVFSTLHTNDAPGAIPRLIDMGIKPFIIAPAVNLVIAQRLVRVVCKKCAKKYTPDRAIREQIAAAMEGVRREIFDPQVVHDPKLKLVRAQGCDHCAQTGYKGRQGVFEIFTVTGAIEELVLKGADSNAIRDAAQRAGMTTIAQDAYLKVLDGITTVEEVERISEE
ncbi:MAG: GspE/PulE family protein [Candidatus Andersenbacteria bacterium]